MERKTGLLLAIMLFDVVSGNQAWACKPLVKFTYDKSSLPDTLYYGENTHIPVKMAYYCLSGAQSWILPSSVTARAVSGRCPAMPGGTARYDDGKCHLDLVVSANALDKPVQAFVKYRTPTGDFGSLVHTFRVIPHPPVLDAAATQPASVSQPFEWSLKSLVHYHDENAQAGQAPVLQVTPMHLGGLRYYPQTMKLTGVPQQTGMLEFLMALEGTGASVPIRILVGNALSSRPVFKAGATLPVFVAEKPWQFDLPGLVEASEDNHAANVPRFRLDEASPNPEWLHVEGDPPTLLKGIPPLESAGQTVRVTLFATNNTGGDSEPHVFRIPVLFDASARPFIIPFSLYLNPGEPFSQDLTSSLVDPLQGQDLRVILDRLNPEVAWLRINPQNPTVLEGGVPQEAAGKRFMLTLRVATARGGSSEPVEISLDVAANPSVGGE